METKECAPANLADAKSAVHRFGITKLVYHFDVEIDSSNFNIPLNCIKTVFKVNDKDIILRGCQLTPKDNMDVCQNLITKEKDIVTHCSFCNQHGCNSAPFKTVSVSLVALLIPVLMVL